MAAPWSRFYQSAGYDEALLSHPQLAHLLSDYAQVYAQHLQSHGVLTLNPVLASPQVGGVDVPVQTETGNDDLDHPQVLGHEILEGFFGAIGATRWENEQKAMLDTMRQGEEYGAPAGAPAGPVPHAAGAAPQPNQADAYIRGEQGKPAEMAIENSMGHAQARELIDGPNVQGGRDRAE